MKVPDRLYHLAEAANVPSIMKHGLMSTTQLLHHAGLSKTERQSLLRSHRRENVRISESVTIRDQKPMPPAALAPVLGGSLTPGDWYEFLNGLVFLWPDEKRLMRHLSACRDRSQVLLTFSTAAIVEDYEKDTLVSPINTGNARRRAAFRDQNTFMPYKAWLRDGWPTGQRRRIPAEFALRCRLPTTAPYLLKISNL